MSLLKIPCLNVHFISTDTMVVDSICVVVGGVLRLSRDEAMHCKTTLCMVRRCYAL